MSGEPNSNDSGGRSNADSDLWAEAFVALDRADLAIVREGARVKQAQKGLKLAKKARKDTLLRYTALGVPAAQLEQMAEEGNLTEEERNTLYAAEAIARRSLGLIDSRDKTLTNLMRRANATPPASRDAMEKIAGSRAFSDGYNSALQGGRTISDNPHFQGTIRHAEWHRGCLAGLEMRGVLDGKDVSPIATLSAKADAAVAETIATDVADELGGDDDWPAGPDPTTGEEWPVTSKPADVAASVSDAKVTRGKGGRFQRKQPEPDPQPDIQDAPSMFGDPIEMPTMPN